MQLVELRLGTTIESIVADVHARGGNQGDVAEVLGIDRSTVSRWMKDLQLEARRRGRPTAEARA
jgi:transposase-like protein